jgi:hypothetical protein
MLTLMDYVWLYMKVNISVYVEPIRKSQPAAYSDMARNFAPKPQKRRELES